jgi:hypothetical protein
MTKPFKLPMPNRQCALLGVSVMTLVPAFAQTSVPAEAAATTDTGVMQTVVVPGHAPQAGNRAGKLVVGSARAPIDIPFAVSSIPGDRMRDQAGTTLQDALRNVPGAQADSGFNGSHAQSFILRGAVADSGTGANGCCATACGCPIIRMYRHSSTALTCCAAPAQRSVCAANRAARSTSSPANRTWPMPVWCWCRRERTMRRN